MEIAIVVDAKARIGEAPIWSEFDNKLYWVDIENRMLFRFDPASDNNEAFDLGTKVTTVVPVNQDKVLLGVIQGIALYDLKYQKLTILHELDSDRKNNRCNDGKCDPAGRFWVGTQDNDLLDDAGSLYCLDLDGKVRKMLDNLKNPNGIVWSLDNSTMFFIDTYTMKVDAFDYNYSTGKISNRRTAVNIPVEYGVPDGMTMDQKGNIWIAHFFGACITNWNPYTGEFLRKIDVPAKNVTACWFGNSDMKTLFITTARDHTNEDDLEKYPYAGGLFAIKLGVSGYAGYPFKGKLVS